MAQQDPEAFAAYKLQMRLRREADEMKQEMRVATWSAWAADTFDEALAAQEQAVEDLQMEEDSEEEGQRTPPGPPPGGRPGGSSSSGLKR